MNSTTMRIACSGDVAGTFSQVGRMFDRVFGIRVLCFRILCLESRVARHQVAKVSSSYKCVSGRAHRMCLTSCFVSNRALIRFMVFGYYVSAYYVQVLRQHGIEVPKVVSCYKYISGRAHRMFLTSCVVSIPAICAYEWKSKICIRMKRSLFLHFISAFKACNFVF